LTLPGDIDAGLDGAELRRFVAAQERGGKYERALAELRAGGKRSHWMWFVFPLVAGLGQSQMSREYAIASLPEAVAYLEHPLLGLRLRECAEALLEHDGLTAAQILGGVDALKLRSSMTLFARAGPEESLFRRVLERFYEGEEDPATIRLLSPS
jgi:uncharacterized protein (DUF1810 family)